MALVVNGDETDKDSRSMASSEKGDDSYEEDIVCVVWSQSVSSETVHEEEETLVELADAQTENVSYPSQFDIVEEDRHAHTTVPVRSSVVVPEKVVSQTALVKRGDEEYLSVLLAGGVSQSVGGGLVGQDFSVLIGERVSVIGGCEGPYL